MEFREVAMSELAYAPPTSTPASIPGARHRIGAVARMLRMPVATLRVWERRYVLTQTEPSPSGQRLYSDDDVKRLTLIRQLTDLGHAIGTLAPLDMAQLRRVAATHANTLASSRRSPPSLARGSGAVADATPGGRPRTSAPAPSAATRSLRLAVVGPALDARLRKPTLLRQTGRAIQVVGPYGSIPQAADALRDTPVDAVLIHEPQLQEGWLDALKRTAPALAELPMGVLFGFATEGVCASLADAGVMLLREPQPDAALAQWVGHFPAPAEAAAPSDDDGSPQEPNAEALRVNLPASPAPRRWDDTALAAFANLSTTVACECPRHTAQLLTQLSQFEAYSIACENSNREDAELHAYLHLVTAEARSLFEDALERVALHEGLLLPESVVARG